MDLTKVNEALHVINILATEGPTHRSQLPDAVEPLRSLGYVRGTMDFIFLTDKGVETAITFGLLKFPGSDVVESCLDIQREYESKLS